MTLEGKQRKISKELIKLGFIPNWYTNFGKLALRIYLNENDEEELIIYFSVTNICYDYRLNMPSNNSFSLLKAFEVINEVYPQNKDPKYDYMKRFDTINIQSFDLGDNGE